MCGNTAYYMNSKSKFTLGITKLFIYLKVLCCNKISHIFCRKPKIWQISNNNQLDAFWSTYTFSINSSMDKHVVILISVYLVDNVNRLATYFSHNFLIFISQYIEKVLKYQDFWPICKKNSSYSLYGLLVEGYNLKNVNFC